MKDAAAASCCSSTVDGANLFTTEDKKFKSFHKYAKILQVYNTLKIFNG